MNLGKNIFVWDIDSCFGGDVGKIADGLKAAGFESAILHHEYLSNWATPQRIALVAALKRVGVAPIGGAAIYGANPTLEGQQAAKLCNDYGLSGFIFDAEGQFDLAATKNPAITPTLLRAFKVLTTTPIGWCYWAFPYMHVPTVLRTAMGYCDWGLPMTYWSWGDDPVSAVNYLQRSWDYWKEFTSKPIVPIGRAYSGDGGTAKADAMIAFEAKARELGAAGVSWWSMQHALSLNLWPTLASMKPFGGVVSPPSPFVPITPTYPLYRNLAIPWLNVRNNHSRTGNFLRKIYPLGTFTVYDTFQGLDYLWAKVSPTAQEWVAMGWAVKI
jgi:hypothetical protein